MGEREAVRSWGGLLPGAPTPPGSLCSPPMSPKGDSGQAPITKSIAHTSHGVLLNILDAAQQVRMSSPLSLLILTQKMAFGVVYRRMSHQK